MAEPSTSAPAPALASASATGSAPVPAPATDPEAEADAPAPSAGPSHHNVADAPIAATAGPIDDDEFELTEASWDDSHSTGSTSIASSIYRHSYENGRRFHRYKHGRYPMPNDEAEQNREDLKHAMMLEMTDGRLTFAGLGENPQKIMDVGTGTGIWAIEMADQYPSAEVLGIDLSPIQPTWVPTNCKFLVDDAEDEWLNGKGWDLVHFRSMSSVLRDVPKVLGYAFDAIKPGGWIELQELEAFCYCDDGTMPDDDPLLEFYQNVRESLGRFRMDLKMPMKLRPLLEAAGFVNVHCVLKKAPIGPWAKDPALRVVGMYCREAVQDLIPAMTGKPFQSLGLSAQECEVMAVGVRKTLKDMSRHRYLPMHFWTAQRPE